MKRNNVGIALISVLVLLLIYIKIFDKSDNIPEEKVREIIGTEELKHDVKEIDFLNASLNLEEMDTFTYKEMNYPIMKFFKDVNSEDYSNIKVFPELLNTPLISDSYFSNSYGSYSNLLYSISSFEKIEDIYLYKVLLKDEKSGDVFERYISTDGDYIIDKGYIGLEYLNNSSTIGELIIEVISKVILKDETIYMISIYNESDTIIYIDDGMYGFYGATELNKFAHELIGGTSIDYKLLPKVNSMFCVNFKTRENIDLYITLSEDNISTNHKLAQ